MFSTRLGRLMVRQISRGDDGLRVRKKPRSGGSVIPGRRTPVHMAKTIDTYHCSMSSIRASTYNEKSNRSDTAGGPVADVEPLQDQDVGMADHLFCPGMVVVQIRIHRRTCVVGAGLHRGKPHPVPGGCQLRKTFAMHEVSPLQLGGG